MRSGGPATVWGAQDAASAPAFSEGLQPTAIKKERSTRFMWSRITALYIGVHSIGGQACDFGRLSPLPIDPAAAYFDNEPAGELSCDWHQRFPLPDPEETRGWRYGCGVRS